MTGLFNIHCTGESLTKAEGAGGKSSLLPPCGAWLFLWAGGGVSACFPSSPADGGVMSPKCLRWRVCCQVWNQHISLLLKLLLRTSFILSSWSGYCVMWHKLLGVMDQSRISSRTCVLCSSNLTEGISLLNHATKVGNKLIKKWI